MHVYRNRVTDWIVAASMEHARALVIAHYGVTEDEAANPDSGYDLALELVQLDDGELLRVKDDEGGSHTKTCGEWAATEPAGLLCSTEY